MPTQRWDAYGLDRRVLSFQGCVFQRCVLQNRADVLLKLTDYAPQGQDVRMQLSWRHPCASCERANVTITVCREHGVHVNMEGNPPNVPREELQRIMLEAEHLVLSEISKLGDGARNG